jgi:hypothetical protein
VDTEDLKKMKHLFHTKHAENAKEQLINLVGDTEKSKRLCSGEGEGETKSKAERFIE